MSCAAAIMAAGAFAGLRAAAEPAPKALTGAAISVSPITHVTAVMELADGTLLISNAKGPQVARRDPSGKITIIGAAGAGDGRYAQPGGFYRGANNTIQLVDHSGPRVLVLSPAGELLKSFSAAERGVTKSSDSDADTDRLDANGIVYHASMGFSGLAPTRSLIKLDPAAQKKTTIAPLAQPETKTISGGDGMTFSRAVVGSPADDWGVAPDGRVAIVHAKPYRVEWISPAGASTMGPDIAIDVIPYTDADKQAWQSAHTDLPSVGVSAVGSSSPAASLPTRFADTKPAFVGGAVQVSASGQVWVKRQMPFGAAMDVFDVFDGAGARVRRVAVPAGSTIVGFGPHAVFMREDSKGGAEVLKRYALQ